MSKLVIVVPANRHRCGRALLLGSDGATRLGPLRVLATASGWAAKRHANEARDWHRPFGHPPTGTYVVSGSLPPGVSPRPRRLRRFGALGALVLTPTSGHALEAAAAGRKRFLLHGGPGDRRGRLRPTFGGFRVSDRELVALLRAVNDANAASDPVSTVEVVETTDRPPWTDDGPHDRAGRFRPSFAPRRKRARASMTLPRAALVALGFGIAGRGLKAEASTGRRGFVGLALLTLGALGSSACSGPDAPSPEPDPGPSGWDPTVGGAGASPGAGNAPDAGAGDDGGGPGGGYAGGGYGGDDQGGGGADPGGPAPGDGTGPGAGDDTGGDSSGGAG